MLEVLAIAGRLAIISEAAPRILEGGPEAWEIVAGETKATRVRVGTLIDPSPRGVVQTDVATLDLGRAYRHARGALDFDGNGFVNGDDADLWALAFDRGWFAADYDGNGFVNGDDADAFWLDFGSGAAPQARP